MWGTLTPYIAVAKDARTATNVKIPKTDPTAAGCEKLAPFRITAAKQAISVCEEFEKNRSCTDASKSGIDNAMFGMAETSDVDTGMTAPPVMGTLLFIGHRLLKLEVAR